LASSGKGRGGVWKRKPRVTRVRERQLATTRNEEPEQSVAITGEKNKTSRADYSEPPYRRIINFIAERGAGSPGDRALGRQEDRVLVHVALEAEARRRSKKGHGSAQKPRIGAGEQRESKKELSLGGLGGLLKA